MVENMNNYLQKTKKSFAAMECMIKNIEEEEDDSDISDSDSEYGLGIFPNGTRHHLLDWKGYHDKYYPPQPSQVD